MQTLDMDQLQTFVAIAESGSFTEAAQKVGRTQSAVSMQMKRLEEGVGRPLFTRDGRRSRLTDHGVTLLDYARRMLALNAETLAVFRENEIRGKARLGLPDDYAPRILPMVLASFDRAHPTLEIDVTCDISRSVAEKVNRGELDIGIVTFCEVLASQIEDARIVRREPLFFVGSLHHSAHFVDPIPLAVGPESCAWRRQATRAIEVAGLPYRIAYTSSSAAAIAGAVQSGLAIGVLPESALTPDMRRLGERDGFPALMPADIAVIRAESARDAVHDALVEHIASSLDNLSVFYRPKRVAA